MVRTPSWLLIPAIACYVLTSMAGTEGILCVGRDHVALESESAPCCEPQIIQAHADCADVHCTLASCESDPCGPCLDIPLADVHVQPRSGGTPDLRPLAAVPAPALASLAAPEPKTALALTECDTIPPPDVGLTCLASVVLLC